MLYAYDVNRLYGQKIPTGSNAFFYPEVLSAITSGTCGLPLSGPCNIMISNPFIYNGSMLNTKVVTISDMTNFTGSIVIYNTFYSGVWFETNLRNYASGATVTPTNGSNAIDGALNTFYLGVSGALGETLKVDIGATITCKGLSINLIGSSSDGASHNGHYGVETSTDNINWTNVYYKADSFGGGAGAFHSNLLNLGSAYNQSLRYIKTINGSTSTEYVGAGEIIIWG